MTVKHVYTRCISVWISSWLLCSMSCVLDYGMAPCAQEPLSADSTSWTQLLRDYVNAEGLVDYARWQQSSQPLHAYLAWLTTHMPAETATEAEQIAYWINLYNASTVALVLAHYPVKSIQDIEDGKPWDKAFIELPTDKVSLHDIEHGILRKRFTEPRIHFALVCAAISCPPLRQEAYVGETLYAQLDAQATRFIHDSTKQRFSHEKAEISRIFDWFETDFTAEGSLINYLNRYMENKLPAHTKIHYLTYDWRLNEQR